MLYHVFIHKERAKVNKVDIEELTLEKIWAKDFPKDVAKVLSSSHRGNPDYTELEQNEEYIKKIYPTGN